MKRDTGLLDRILRAAKRTLLKPDSWHKFEKTDWSNVDSWSTTYKSGSYRAIWDHSYPSPELVGYIAAAKYPIGARALDVGCGSGRDAVLLANCGFEVHGLDFSPEAIEIAQNYAAKRMAKVSWHCCDVLRTPFETRYFDLITDRGCFHHLSELRRRKYAEEMARILKPGGALLLRGCRVAQPPFYPIDSTSLAAVFDLSLFEIGPDFQLFLTVDGGGLDATLVSVAKRSD